MIEDPYVGAYTSDFVEVNGLRLHYTDWNPDGNPTIVMLHGANVQLHTWDPIAHDLARDHRVVLLDLRGHGDSDWAREGYRVEQFTADLEGLVDQLDLAPFELVGHSLGARIALAYAGENPDAVRHVLLSDTGPEVPKAGARAAQSIVGSTGDIRGFRNHEEVLEHYEKMHPEWLPVFRELHALHQVRENWAGKLVFKADPDLFWITGSIGLKEIPYLWEMCGKITAPTNLIASRPGPFLDEELAQKFVDAVPNAEVTWVETGHYVPREDPDLFCSLVREFVAS